MSKKNVSRPKEFTAIVLAAGKGVRMKSPLPKVLHELCGMPLVCYVLAELAGLKKYVKQIIVVVGYEGKAVEAAVKKFFPAAEFVYQKKQSGTAHAVMVARSKAKHANALILCGDAPLIKKETLRSFIEDFLTNRLSLSLITARVDEPGDLGRIIRDGRGRFAAIREKVDLRRDNGSNEVNSGVYAIGCRLLFAALKKVKKNPGTGEYFLTDIVNLIYRQGHKTGAYVAGDSCQVLGVNTLGELYAADKIIRQRIIGRLVDAGVKIIDPATTYIESGVKIGRETVIFPFTFIEKNVIIGNTCRLGPFIRIRQGTRVRDGVCLGNFLEVNRCDIGKDVTAKHFGYLGDARIAGDVNIGAGTVIANYDGKNKNKTVIGKSAFIGSDSVLVAPVTIGSGAITGAGSVVTRDVKPRTVVVGVPARVLRKKS